MKNKRFENAYSPLGKAEGLSKCEVILHTFKSKTKARCQCRKINNQSLGSTFSSVVESKSKPGYYHIIEQWLGFYQIF